MKRKHPSCYGYLTPPYNVYTLPIQCIAKFATHTHGHTELLKRIKVPRCETQTLYKFRSYNFESTYSKIIHVL